MRILVGNKVDLEEEEREVNKERGQNTVDNFEGSLFMEISALTGTGFDELFEGIVREIRKYGGGVGQHKATVSLNSPKVGGSSCCGKK